MDKHSSRIWRLRKSLTEIEKRIDKLYSERRTKLRVLYRANRDYNLRSISYEDYSKVWDSTLNGYSVEELISGYDSWIRSLEEKKETLESEITEIRRDRERANKALSVSLSMILVFGVIAGLTLFSTELGDITGAAVTTQKVTVEAYYAISLSNDSIRFGSLTHGTENNSAEMNKEGVGASEYYVELSNDSNVPIRLNISGEGNLLNGSNVVGIGNLSWDSWNVSTANVPNIGNDTKMSISEVVSTPDFKLWYNETERSRSYYRFWLDIPLGTLPGIYTNNITFESYESS